MTSSRIEKGLIIDAFSEHPKSKFTPDTLGAIEWKKDTDGIEYIDINHTPAIQEGVLNVEETENGYQVPDIGEILERAFVVVNQQIESILSGTSDKIKEVAGQAKNWEVLISQDYDEAGNAKITTHWRIVRQEANTIPKKDLRALEASVTKEFVEKVSFQVDFALNIITPKEVQEDEGRELPVSHIETPVTEAIEIAPQETVETPPVKKVKKKKVVKLMEKRDPTKYELEKVMKQYTPLQKETLTMEEGQYIEHIQGLFHTFTAGEIQELLSTRGKTSKMISP